MPCTEHPGDGLEYRRIVEASSLQECYLWCFWPTDHHRAAAVNAKASVHCSTAVGLDRIELRFSSKHRKAICRHEQHLGRFRAAGLLTAGAMAYQLKNGLFREFIWSRSALSVYQWSSGSGAGRERKRATSPFISVSALLRMDFAPLHFASA